MSGVVPAECYALGKLQGYLSAYDLAVSMYSGDSSLSAQALEIALWRQWKTTRHRRAALLQLGVRRNWQPTLLAVVVAPGTWPAPKPFLSGSPMRTSARSVFLRYSRTASVTSRTAVYGPVCTVVWQGRQATAAPMPIKRE